MASIARNQIVFWEKPIPSNDTRRLQANETLDDTGASFEDLTDLLEDFTANLTDTDLANPDTSQTANV